MNFLRHLHITIILVHNKRTNIDTCLDKRGMILVRLSLEKNLILTLVRLSEVANFNELSTATLVKFVVNCVKFIPKFHGKGFESKTCLKVIISPFYKFFFNHSGGLKKAALATSQVCYRCFLAR